MVNFLLREAFAQDYLKIVDLLDHVFDGWPHMDIDYEKTEYWVWKYWENTDQESIVIAAFHDSSVVGCSHAMMIPVKVGDEVLQCYYGTDVAVHPEFRKRGLWKKMRDMKFNLAKKRGGSYFFSTSGNPILIKGYRRYDKVFQKKLVNMAWIRNINLQLEQMPMKHNSFYRIGFFLLNSLNKVMRVFEKKPESENYKIVDIKIFDESFDEFYNKISQDFRFIVKKGKDYLNWRYKHSYNENYQLRAIQENCKILGLCVSGINRFQEDYAIGYVLELLTLKEERKLADVLLKDAKKFFEENNVNIVNYLVTDGAYYQNASKKNGFLNTRVSFPLYYAPFKTDKLKNLQNFPSDSIYFSWGDHDNMPSSR